MFIRLVTLYDVINLLGEKDKAEGQTIDKQLIYIEEEMLEEISTNTNISKI